MKLPSFIGILLVGAVLAGVALFGSRGPVLAGGTASGGTRVATVNVGQVFAKYKKAEMYKQEMEELLKPFREEEKKLKKGYEDWQKVLQNATKAEERENAQKALIQYQRAMEDLKRNIQEKVGKRQSDQIVTLYRDVNTAVEAFAKNNGIQLVLAYGEQVDGGDIFNFPNINRKMQGMDLGSAHPLFFHDSLDITNSVISVLNQGAGAVSAVPTSQKKN